MFTRLRVELVAFTPVHVWSGENVILGVDALPVDNGNELCIVDLSMLARNLDKSKVAKLFALLRSGQQPATIAKSISGLLGGSLPCKTRYPITWSARMQYLGARGPTPVRLISPSVVPASALKGYLRTIYLYHVFTSLDKATLSNVLSLVGRNVDRARQAIGRRRMRDARRNLKSLAGPIEELIRARAFTNIVDGLQVVMVDEPEAGDVKLEATVFEVYSLARDTIVAVDRVVAWTSGSLVYNVLVRTPQKLELVNANPSILHGIERVYADAASFFTDRQRLLSAMRSFGCRLLEYEVARVEACVRRGRCRGLSGYLDFLYDLKRRYCQSSSACTVARMGFMTGYAAKTLLPEVKSVDPQLYNDIKSVLSAVYGRPWDDYTVKVSPSQLSGGKTLRLGVGWCKVCVD